MNFIRREKFDDDELFLSTCMENEIKFPFNFMGSIEF